MARKNRTAVSRERAYTRLAVRGWLAVRMQLGSRGVVHLTELDSEGRVIPRCNQGAGRTTFDAPEPTEDEPTCRRCLDLRPDAEYKPRFHRWIAVPLETPELDEQQDHLHK